MRFDYLIVAAGARHSYFGNDDWETAAPGLKTLEDALDIRIPANANLIRNLVHGMQYVQDHVIHFYHLHALDWVDVVSALSADPAKAARIAQSLSPWPNNGESHFAAVKNRLRGFVSGGQLGIFTNGYWGHPAYKLPPEVNLIAVSHYLEALDWQRDVIRLQPYPIDRVWTIAMTKSLGVDSRSHIFAMKAGLSAAAVWMKPIEGPDKGPATIVLDDRGRLEAAAAVAERINRGEQVLALDLSFTGAEWKDGDVWLLQQVIQAQGERPLGIDK